MGRDRESKHKRSRREGRDLFGTGGESLARRLNRPPGMHVERPRRQSDYAKQLREKQMVKRMYGLRERQFRRMYRMAERSRGQTGQMLLALLERRLDNVVFRLGFARTRPQARQFVSHGHVLVDGRRVNIPSYLVQPGQMVSIDTSIRDVPDVQDLAEYHPEVPGWLERMDGAGQVLRVPDRQEIDPDIEEQLIVEFYSR
ncbi:MAG: 30S ribosomal protein S4 [Anaerolineae bacterium]|jgi:small subunit ribosomal protein S4|nr:30S ribosomal protein S4 [Anaerolineae bacterium]